MIEVVEYNPKWPHMFQKEAAKIQAALGDNCITVHHIGSTSVLGLSAKPIIDIVPVVYDIKAIASHNAHMQHLGYEVKNEYGFMMRRFFIKPNAFHVHVFEKDNPEIERHLKFRDWMRTNPEDREAYAYLKNQLAKKNANDMNSYCFAKDEFVANIDEKAGWQGFRVVKALSEREWATLKSFRYNYYHNLLKQVDPYRDWLDDPANVHLVLLKKTDIIGYTHVQFCPDKSAMLHFIFIEKSHQKKKFGTGLLVFIQKWLRGLEVKSLYAHKCKETLKFFRKNGFIDMPYHYGKEDDEGLIGKLLLS